MKKISVFFIVALFSMVSLAQAHSVWINSFESHAHKPPHTMVSLGWGMLCPWMTSLLPPMAALP